MAGSLAPDFSAVDAELADRTDFLAGLSETTFFEVEPASTFAADDAALAPLALSVITRATFLSAAEQLSTGSPSAEHPRGAPAFALLRSALESAAVTIWLLESDDPAVRATRLFSEVWGDIRDSDRLAVSLGGVLESLADQERAWKTAHSAVFGDAEASARQLPASMASKIDVAAAVVADFTMVPGAAAAIRASWHGFGSLSRGRAAAFDLADGSRAMIAGSRSLVLDVLETAASLYHVRAVSGL